ncbi:MAG TPA: hypothetical protein VFK94_07030, partial [Patescibacteria group bacterium]|nr:hypothetical protein [Patescibacteria group bacterium]
IGSTGNGKITVGVVDPYLITNTGTFQAALEFRTTATAGADDFIFTLGGTERARLTETGNLTIVGTLTAQSTSTSSFAGAIDMQNNVILNIGNSGTDFVATTGALNLAGVLTANGGITLGTSQTFSATSGTISATGLSSSTIGTTSANLTLSTTTSGTLALTSAGALNLSAGAASTVTLANVANAFNFDADTLSIDALNNRVGIGTVAPASKLEVSGGTGSVNLKITADTDNVNEADQPSITLSQDNGSVVSHIGFFDSNNAFSLYNSFGDSLSFGTSGRKNDVSIDLNGNLGVGAGFGPFTYKLQVAPTANATAGQTVFIQDATATTGSTNLVLRAGAGQ